jgi:hypothetical protein
MQVVRQKRGDCKLKDRDRPLLCAIARNAATRTMTARFNFQTATMRTVFKIVITGLDPVIHLLRKNFLRRWMDARIPSTPRLRRALGARPPKLDSEGGKSGHDKLIPAARCVRVMPLNFRPSEIRGRRECRALDAPAASHAK